MPSVPVTARGLALLWWGAAALVQGVTFRASTDGVVIEGNGGWVSLIDYASLSSDPTPFVEALAVIGSNVLPDSGFERDVSSDAASSVTVNGNTPDGVNQSGPVQRRLRLAGSRQPRRRPPPRYELGRLPA